MGTHRYNNFGRTRQLKNIAGEHEKEVEVVAVASLDASSDGYSTESQRYLHVLAIDKHVGTNLTVTIYGYAHAFGKWFPLETMPKAEMTPSDDSVVSIRTAMTVTAIDTGAAEADQTAAQREMATFEIAGIDRVAFVGTTAHVRVLAACSTF